MVPMVNDTTTVVPTIPAIVIAMGVAVVPGIAAIATNARVTQVRVDASRVSHD